MRINNFLNFSFKKIEKKIMTNHFVFVYGTLKKGEPNHHWLTEKNNGFSRFIGPAETKQKYPLVIASKYNIPFLLDSPGKGENVMGEVYEVDEKMLLNLDVLEDHPTFYIREMTPVNVVREEGKESPEHVECWTYFIKNFKPTLLSETCLKNYSSYGSHGKPYAERESRDPGYHARTDVLIS